VNEVTIETERLLLRMPTLADAVPFAALFNDPTAMEFIGGVHPETSDNPECPVRRWLERWEANGVGPLIAERRDDGVVVGRAGLHIWDTKTWTPTSYADAGEHAQPELGWALIREHWGNGYATEAARAVREWVWTLGIERLISVIAPANARSQRVAEKLGCTPGETVTLFDTDAAVVWEHPR
jgi:ribosomal-protein-alanine N-acetyltransferase